MDTIFEYTDHFSYLNHRLSTKSTVYGTKSKFADSLRVKASFLSQVLARKFSLSLEQADLANHFFEHTSDEAEFFILLVSRDRAGTDSLRKHFANQISAILKKRQLVVERLGRKSEVSDEAKGVYYSSWIYPAVHLGCSLPKINSLADLSAEIKIPVDFISQIIEFLMENNLVTKNQGRYSTTDTWIRIDRSSPHIVKHHSNWRNKAIQNIETARIEDLHYSGLFTLDAATADRIKNIFLESIKTSLKAIESAPEENLYQLNADFFKL